MSVPLPQGKKKRGFHFFFRLKLLEAVGGGSSEGGASKEAMQVLKEENR